jgi:hypothetical protein
MKQSAIERANAIRHYKYLLKQMQAALTPEVKAHLEWSLRGLKAAHNL